MFLRARNLGDRRGTFSLFVFWNLGDRRGEIDSSSLLGLGDFVGVMLSIIEVHKGSKRANGGRSSESAQEAGAISKVQPVNLIYSSPFQNSCPYPSLCLGAKIASVTPTMLRS